jgi:hypothetical protein
VLREKEPVRSGLGWRELTFVSSERVCLANN